MFSTVAGKKSSADSKHHQRGFAVKFLDLIHIQKRHTVSSLKDAES
jgi:catalase